MSRIYYITFKMEGPSAEVLRLTRLLRRITVRRGELCRWLRRYPAMSAGNAKPLAEIFSTLQSEITGRSIENLSDGWQVLTLEVRQEYPDEPESFAQTELWQTLQQRFLPDGICYYRVTDIERRRICTNDVHGKYFPENYMLCVMSDAGRQSAELDSLRGELLQDEYICRKPSGQAMYLSYWQTSTLRHLLREALSMRRLAPIDERHVLWQKAWEWSAGLGFGLIWGIVERRADGQTSPCCHCRKIRSLQLQNKQRHAKITETRQRIDDTIRKLQRCIANNSDPSPDITRELAKSQQALRQLEHSDFTA